MGKRDGRRLALSVKAADPAYVRQLANDRSETRRTVTEHGATGELGGTFLSDLRAWGRGDSGAFGRLAREAKSITGGELLIAPSVLPGYLPAATASAPMRFLGSQHEVIGRELHVLREGDSIVAQWRAEGMTKPLSDAALDEVVSLVFKAAALVAIPDELNADSGHVAQEVVARGMGTKIGQVIDVALLDGTGDRRLPLRGRRPPRARGLSLVSRRRGVRASQRMFAAMTSRGKT